MTRRAPLPPSALRGPFLSRDAGLLGMTEGRLRASDLSRPVRGARLAGPGDATLSVRCAALSLRLGRGAVISDETAAAVRGLPLPRRLARATRLHVTVQAGTRAPHSAEIAGHQRRLLRVDVDEHSGFPMTSPLRTLCDLTIKLSVAEAVAIADYLIRADRGRFTIDDLSAAFDRYPGPRGKATRERVLDLADAFAESPKESELRVVLISAGLRRPECNVVVRDERGRFVARVDLAYPELRIAIEYESDYHRDPDQYRRDTARRRRLEALGWIYLPVTQGDLDDPRQLIADIAAALARRAVA